MGEEELRDYILDKKVITIPEVQDHFGLKYKVVKGIIESMVLEGILYLKDDLHFEYINIFEDVPVFYKLVLWDCILKHNINVTTILQDYSLSFTMINEMISWMTEKNYISTTQEILITKEKFVALYGDVEEMIGELQRLCHFPLPKLKTKEELQNLKKLLQERIDFLVSDDEDYELEEELDFELSKHEHQLLIKDFYDALETIILKDTTIERKETIKALHNNFYSNSNLSPAKKRVCENLINHLNYMSDAQFSNLKRVILE